MWAMTMTLHPKQYKQTKLYHAPDKTSDLSRDFKVAVGNEMAVADN